ncbi:BlaI/MecI/CopY family transcriptional regulator [Anaerorhabdus sp.]|jgi:BlaI family transcriptional regulator, penicillinase repressor|uniref:BlaI/MecI/CopY family transcriptional regulator n=1 Tax=Anaerorhabdus sp. TaxID=1872524 RepID=UPI002FC737F4
MMAIKKIPDSELDVMNVLWLQKEPIKTSEILEKLDKSWTMSTVQVLLTRLEERGYVGSKKEGRLKYYYSILKEEEYKKLETTWLYNKIHNGSLKSLILSLVETEELDDNELNELESILSKMK